MLSTLSEMNKESSSNKVSLSYVRTYVMVSFLSPSSPSEHVTYVRIASSEDIAHSLSLLLLLLFQICTRYIYINRVRDCFTYVVRLSLSVSFLCVCVCGRYDNRM